MHLSSKQKYQKNFVIFAGRIRIYSVRNMKPDKFTSAFLTLRDKLYRSAVSFLKNDEDASDALQDVFCNLWSKGRVQSDAEAGNMLFASLRNLCIDRLRRRHTEPLSDDQACKLTVEPAEVDETAMLERLLTEGLTPLQRRIYTLMITDGCDYTETSRALDISVDAVRMHLSRARKKMRENYIRIKR